MAYQALRLGVEGRFSSMQKTHRSFPTPAATPIDMAQLNAASNTAQRHQPERHGPVSAADVRDC
jgi:hypothetical protein